MRGKDDVNNAFFL